jgi:hypothetical protein
MAPEEVCDTDMLVIARWQGRSLAVPLSQLTPVADDEATIAAVGDWITAIPSEPDTTVYLTARPETLPHKAAG